MCIICIEFQKQVINFNEVKNILSEMQSTIDPKHLIEIENMLHEEQEYDDG